MRKKLKIMKTSPLIQNCCPSSKMQKKTKNNFGNIFKIIIENRRIAVRVQNLATESFKFILYIILFLTIRLMIKLLTLIQIQFILPIPILVWEIDLSENWLKGICNHTPEEDHMDSEHIYCDFIIKFDKCDICNQTYNPITDLNMHNRFVHRDGGCYCDKCIFLTKNIQKIFTEKSYFPQQNLFLL